MIAEARPRLINSLQIGNAIAGRSRLSQKNDHLSETT